MVPQVQVGTAILPASSAKPVKIAAGSYYILGGITFNKPFSDLPHIVVSLTSTPGGSSNLVPRIYKVSKNQFSAIIYNVGTTTATLVKNVGVGYIAAVNNFSPNTPSAIDSSLVVSSLTAAIMPDSTSALYHINVDWPTTNAAYYVLDRSPVSNFSSGVFSASIFQPLSSYIDKTTCFEAKASITDGGALFSMAFSRLFSMPFSLLIINQLKLALSSSNK